MLLRHHLESCAHVLGLLKKSFKKGKGTMDSMEGMRMERRPWIHMAKLPGDFYSEPDSSESLYPSVNKGLS